MTGSRPRGRRWRLDEAIEDSDLPPMVRHALHTLLRRAVAATGLIPDERQPTVTELQELTGMRRQSLAEALRHAEAKGWLVRKRGGGAGNPTRYVPKLPSESVPTGGTQ